MEQNEIISACCLLLTIAKADEILEDEEIKNIKEIIIDFFNIETNKIDHIINESTAEPRADSKHIRVPNYDYVLDGDYDDPLYQAYLNNPEILNNIEEET